MRYYIGLDLSAKSTAICVIDERGEVVNECEAATEVESLEPVLEKYRGAECVVESAPLAEWLCKVVEAIGCRIKIIDARRAQAIMKQSKKTDRIDAQQLAQICRTGWYTEVHRKSGESRDLRSYLTARKQLVDCANAIGLSIRGLLKAHGIKVGKTTNLVSAVQDILKQAECSTTLRAAIRPLLASYKELQERQMKMYKKLTKITKKTEDTKLLMTVPGVGPATAAAFVATIDDPNRFSSADKVSSYIGLVPSIYQSGETEYRGRITKTGDVLLRWLLVEAANSLMTHTKDDHPIKLWGKKLEKEKGTGKARVAVARKLSCLLYTVWKNRTPYDIAVVG